MANNSENFDIKIINKSGSTQNYVLFAEPSPIDGLSYDAVWPSIIQKSYAPKEASVQFSVRRDYVGICGTSMGPPTIGTDVQVTGMKPVKLGVQSNDGTITPGTSLKLMVDEDYLMFAGGATSAGRSNAFSMAIGGFDARRSKSRNWVIGMGINSTSTGKQVPLSVFVPQPNKEYQVVEPLKYYIVCRDIKVGSLVEIKRMGEPVLIDFAVRPAKVTITHDDRGRFVFQ